MGQADPPDQQAQALLGQPAHPVLLDQVGLVDQREPEPQALRALLVQVVLLGRLEQA